MFKIENETGFRKQLLEFSFNIVQIYGLEEGQDAVTVESSTIELISAQAESPVVCLRILPARKARYS